MTIHQVSQTQPNLDSISNHFNTMPHTSKASPSTLTIKERDDSRTQPWKAFMHVTHTADKPIIIGSNVRLLGQRVNAHVG